MTRHRFVRSAWVGLAIEGVLLLAAARVPAQEPPHAQDSPKVVTITARRFEFSPSQITLVKGETVTLRVTSEDVTHGLFLRPLGIDEQITPGGTHDITVTPQVAGTYRAICDHFCGAGHGGMKMTIVVQDAASTGAAGK
jgi:cytochrome c oxidase subunit II